MTISVVETIAAVYNEPCSTCQRGSAKENLLGSAKLSASNEVCARNKKKERKKI